jgi:Big-like domain-containing protein
MPFEAVAADRRSPDPDRWHLTPPPARTRSSLRVAFGEPLDHALASRLIDVLDARGVPVPGSVELTASDSAWVFTPTSAWTAGEFTLRIGGSLEDIAGNNIARVFDVDRTRDSAGIDRDVAGSTRTLRFRIL